MNTYTVLITAPLAAALFVLIPWVVFRNIVTILFIVVLGVLSITNIVNQESVVMLTLPHSLHQLFTVLDYLLLFYFLWRGILAKSTLVTLYAVVQIVLYTVVLSFSTTFKSSDILIDHLSAVMYLVINIVGGAIIVYALKYIESEEFSRFKKNGFIAILLFFLSVMNFIVSTNNIEIFFLLFELTTLCSYLLIGYRGDELSVNNSIRALWMNQIGGVAILIALVFSILEYNTVYFDILIEHINALYMLPIVFLVLAAFVKGASVPFDKWLIGAMVAPTPVSAILHSATMVKIAPFLILKLSPAMSGFVSLGVTLFGTFVFFTATLLALSKDYFKEILGYSTIALLALMMALAAVGTPEALTAVLLLLVFHAVSKAMLFLQAGILEKSFHLKYVDDIDSLINRSPLTVFFIIVGFASLTLPPFGVFMGKFIAIESLSNEMATHPLYVFAFLFLVLGSVLLTLLYFKVVTKLFAQDVDENASHVKISKFYTLPSFLLLFLLFGGIFVLFTEHLVSSLEVIAPLVLVILAPVLSMGLLFKKAHRVKEYNCGEKEDVKLSMYYFNLSDKYKKLITVVATLGIVVLIAGALV